MIDPNTHQLLASDFVQRSSYRQTIRIGDDIQITVLGMRGNQVRACRHCMRLNYASQQASKRDRAADRSWDLRRALGCEIGFLCAPAEYIQKPKGMPGVSADQRRHERPRKAFFGAYRVAYYVLRTTSP
ncbi:carbon storage regulator [Pseudomonas sp. DB1]|uniref:Carbon storage regulator n=1 Tax=Metapseudomonas boanensis TaxID=2822138 RepID=A0ABS5XK52_9GAMM|nr:carbon storage regulator [Pseudomonas boanensis]MBT8768063.1 carbon storage regulator [Pseudomonas boanensis]